MLPSVIVTCRERYPGTSEICLQYLIDLEIFYPRGEKSSGKKSRNFVPRGINLILEDPKIHPQRPRDFSVIFCPR